MPEAREYIIQKGAYFYRDRCQGYTEYKFNAGRYTKREAEAEASVEPWHMKAIHQDEVPAEREPDRVIADLSAQKDGAYAERNKLVRLLASLFPSGIKKTAIERRRRASEEWPDPLAHMELDRAKKD